MKKTRRAIKKIRLPKAMFLLILLLFLLIPVVAKGGDIREIRLRRTLCFGMCPAYSVTLHSDGSAYYYGSSYVTKLGAYSGRVNPMHFKLLSQALEQLGFFDLNERYAKGVTDLPSAITTATKETTSKSVINYGNSAPIGLWAIEMAIDAIAAKIEWRKAPPQKSAPL